MKTTVCPKCGRKFKSTNAEKTPNCFYCELKKLTTCVDGSFIDPDQADINTARLFSGTYTEEQYKEWDGQLALVEEGKLYGAEFPGLPEEFEDPENVEWTKIVLISGWFPTNNSWESAKFFQECLSNYFLPVRNLVYDKVGDRILFDVTDFFKNERYIRRTFLTIAEHLGKKVGREIEWVFEVLEVPEMIAVQGPVDFLHKQCLAASGWRFSVVGGG